jgi:hypothetical protein
MPRSQCFPGRSPRAEGAHYQPRAHFPEAVSDGVVKSETHGFLQVSRFAIYSPPRPRSYPEKACNVGFWHFASFRREAMTRRLSGQKRTHAHQQSIQRVGERMVSGIGTGQLLNDRRAGSDLAQFAQVTSRRDQPPMSGLATSSIHQFADRYRARRLLAASSIIGAVTCLSCGFIRPPARVSLT